MYLSSEAGINRRCPLAVCNNPLYLLCFSRTNPLGLIVALSDNQMAEGSFFWDNGDGIGRWTLSVGHYIQGIIDNKWDLMTWWFWRFHSV